MTQAETKAATNRANAQGSTGPKTAEGKAVVAANATRHGILASRLFLADEQPAEFDALLDDLVAALKPTGALEMVLVERIAAAIWRQRRLVSAETATIELDRASVTQRREVEKVLGLGYSTIENSDLVTAPEDAVQLKWCEAVMAEYNDIDRRIFDTKDFSRLEAEAPTMFEQAKDEAEGQDESLDEYFSETPNLLSWAMEIHRWCKSTAEKLRRKPAIRTVADLVRGKESAPIRNELLSRYQTALDNELYKAIRALREQQEWRMRSGITVEMETLAEATG